MNFIHIFLAQNDVADLIHTPPKPEMMSPKEMLILLGSFILATAFSLFIAVRFFSKKKSYRRRKYKHRPGDEVSEPAESSGRRRRRRSVPPMNPTLAQTGGLPPRREAGVPPPPMP